MGIRRIAVYTTAAAGITGCLLDLISFFVFASRYSGYDPVKQSLSYLGSSNSPVSDCASYWWIIFGILIILFAVGFYLAYLHNRKFIRLAAICIGLYGLGEGLGSGLFKFDIVGNAKTASYLFHEIFGSIGIFAILVLPFIVAKVASFEKKTGFRIFTRYIIVFGFVFFVLFSLRLLDVTTGLIILINRFTGLWQKLFLLNYYIFLIVLGIIMIKDSRNIV